MAPAIPIQRPRILFLDAYDSFSNNIVALVEQNIHADVVKIFIDDPVLRKVEASKDAAAFIEYLRGFDAVIAGPGPGSAECDDDVGLMKELWKLQNEDLIPVLGICLGFQSLCLAFDAGIERLAEPKHGIITNVLHRAHSIFRGVKRLMATQYHSLHVRLGHPIQLEHAVRYPAQLWEPTKQCPYLEPLAWDFDSDRNGAVLMAAKHVDKPFWGVQFHPESICTNSEGMQIIKNWWEDAQLWNRKQVFRNIAKKDFESSIQSRPISLDDLWRERGYFNGKNQKTYSHESTTAGLDSDTITPIELASLVAHGDGNTLPDLPPTIVHCATIGSGQLTTAEVCELLGIASHEAIVLESGLQPNLTPMAVGTGRYSIIGLIIPEETLRIHYYAGSRNMQLRDGTDEVHTEWTVSDPWPYIREVMQSLRPSILPKGPTWAPFWGGLMGYTSYEAGLETIDVCDIKEASYPDICFAYITRSVVMDHQTKKIYLQSIRGEYDHEWVEMVKETMYEAVCLKSQSTTPSIGSIKQENPLRNHAHNMLRKYVQACVSHTVSELRYHDKIRSCQEFIANGHSYELCLTTQSSITATPKPTPTRLSFSEDNEQSWNLYKRLTGINPAPFSAYIRLHNVHILSSSPERYICWDRSQNAQCRPIKGTVQKKRGVTAESAREILNSSKERAENLMIVDLTRHQLHGVYGSHSVRIKQLMEVEEYETVWQLVTVVDAVPDDIPKSRIPGDWEEPKEHALHSTQSSTPDLGFQAFVQSLPPGSMTGAPKKRSCEILQQVEEGGRRGIYSGVLGYLDVGGGGDFSVVIRTAVKIDDQTEPGKDVWHIGAGGAITSQSTVEGEYEEMFVKLQSTARVFRDDYNIDIHDPQYADILAALRRDGGGSDLDDYQLLQTVFELFNIPRPNTFDGDLA